MNAGVYEDQKKVWYFPEMDIGGVHAGSWTWILLQEQFVLLMSWAICPPTIFTYSHHFGFYKSVL